MSTREENQLEAAMAAEDEAVLLRHRNRNKFSAAFEDLADLLASLDEGRADSDKP